MHFLPLARCLLSAMLLLACPVGWAAISPDSPTLESLSAAQRTKLQNGEMVTVAENLPGAIWPRMILFQKVNATPEEVAAVFSDYASAVHYIPNVKISRIQSSESPCVQEVYYELALPLLPNERYVALNTLRPFGKEGFQIAWHVAKGRFFKSSTGGLTLTPFSGGALMRYENLVDPGAKIAKLLKQRAVRQAQETLSAIATRVETLKRDNPTRLAALVEDLRKNLAAAP